MVLTGVVGMKVLLVVKGVLVMAEVVIAGLVVKKRVVVVIIGVVVKTGIVVIAMVVLVKEVLMIT